MRNKTISKAVVDWLPFIVCVAISKFAGRFPYCLYRKNVQCKNRKFVLVIRGCWEAKAKIFSFQSLRNNMHSIIITQQNPIEVKIVKYIPFGRFLQFSEFLTWEGLQACCDFLSLDRLLKRTVNKLCF